MAGVYYRIQSAAAADAVQCGLKLSEHADRDIRLPGESQPRRVMTAWLHPDDQPKHGTDASHVCLRLEVDPARCYVGDADLYRMGQAHPVLLQRYLETLILLRDYRFGTFRAPECLVPASVLDTQIAVLGRVMDVPVLYENSETLYLQSLMAAYEEVCQDNGNALFLSWCRLLEAKGLVARYTDKDGTREVYLSKTSGKMLVLEVPDRQEAEVWP